jgi:hypothetical protein
MGLYQTVLGVSMVCQWVVHAGLLAEAEEENAVAGERAVHAEENLAARVLREVDHDVAEKDDVEGLARGKGQAEVALLKAAEALDVGVDFPLIAGADEVFDQEAGGQAAVDFDALIAAGAGAFDHFGGDVGAEDIDSPPGEQGKMLAQHDGERVGFLARGTGGGPEAEGAGGLAAAMSAGSSCSRRRSKVEVSRKKLVSLMVMASATER